MISSVERRDSPRQSRNLIKTEDTGSGGQALRQLQRPRPACRENLEEKK